MLSLTANGIRVTHTHTYTMYVTHTLSLSILCLSTLQDDDNIPPPGPFNCDKFVCANGTTLKNPVPGNFTHRPNQTDCCVVSSTLLLSALS